MLVNFLFHLNTKGKEDLEYFLAQAIGIAVCLSSFRQLSGNDVSGHYFFYLSSDPIGLAIFVPLVAILDLAGGVALQVVQWYRQCCVVLCGAALKTLQHCRRIVSNPSAARMVFVRIYSYLRSCFPITSLPSFFVVGFPYV